MGKKTMIKTPASLSTSPIISAIDLRSDTMVSRSFKGEKLPECFGRVTDANLCRLRRFLDRPADRGLQQRGMFPQGSPHRGSAVDGDGDRVRVLRFGRLLLSSQLGQRLISGSGTALQFSENCVGSSDRTTDAALRNLAYSSQLLHRFIQFAHRGLHPGAALDGRWTSLPTQEPVGTPLEIGEAAVDVLFLHGLAFLLGECGFPLLGFVEKVFRPFTDFLDKFLCLRPPRLGSASGGFDALF